MFRLSSDDAVNGKTDEQGHGTPALIEGELPFHIGTVVKGDNEYPRCFNLGSTTSQMRPES